jgi:hypothetical protein
MLTCPPGLLLLQQQQPVKYSLQAGKLLLVVLAFHTTLR